MTNLKQNPILILDFGSQYTQLIGRRLRELGIYCEIYPYSYSESAFKDLAPCGIILSGGPSSTTAHDTPRAPEWVFTAQIPVLGICYGMQTMAIQFDGLVEACQAGEYGFAEITVGHPSVLLDGIFDKHNKQQQAVFDVWMSHGDQVTRVPPQFNTICSSANAPIAGIAHETKPWYGLQFHPEVTQTVQGMAILQRFAETICGAKRTWTLGKIIEQTVEDIQQQVGDEDVILGLSGGVDSSVVAALINKAIGHQLTCVFVDNGLLRQNEKDQVKALFADNFNLKLITVDAEERFLTALKGVICPEQKRKIIGRTFIEVFDEEAQKLPGVKWLAQGTIYSDVIESAKTHLANGAEVIKSHHNVGGLPETLNLKLLEPIRELFKDEVRKIGLELGLPHDLLMRHPFPGPGLGVRILEEVTKDYANILRKADAIFIEELYKSDLYHEVSQAFAVFLPVKSVGVMGDARRYEFVICLRAVKTIDFMTAEWAELPWKFLSHVSNRIMNEVSGISRVVYDISGKPPATIEWE